MLHRMQHRMMLDTGCDHMIAGLHQSSDREIVTLRPSRGEHDLRCRAPEQRRNRFSRALHRSPCLLPVMVNRGSVAKLLPKVGAHSLEYFGQKRSGSVIVQVDALHTASILREICAPQRRSRAGTPRVAVPPIKIAGSYLSSIGTYRLGY